MSILSKISLESCSFKVMSPAKMSCKGSLGVYSALGRPAVSPSLFPSCVLPRTSINPLLTRQISTLPLSSKTSSQQKSQRFYLPSLVFLSTLSILALVQQDEADSKTSKYEVHQTKSVEQAKDYCKTAQSASRYLAYRDIPGILEKYVQGKKALDYGAGTGISAAFLQKLGFNVVGVDVSPEMLAEAASLCPDISFDLVQDGKIPNESGTYDLVFSGWVLFELGTEQAIVAYLKEAARVLKPEGRFVAVTGSQDMFSKDWLIYGTDYPENQNPQSGKLCKVFSRDVTIAFTDYYWSEADYQRLFKEAGFRLLEVHYPLGKEGEGYAWRSEKSHSPYVIFVAEALS